MLFRPISNPLQALSACAGPTPMRELRLMRYMVFCLACDASRPDTASLMDNALTSQYKHPLMMYGAAYDHWHPKSIIFPSWVSMYGVHQAWVFTGGHSSVQREGNCTGGLHMIHLGNLHKHQYPIDSAVMNTIISRDPAWWWMYLPDLPFFSAIQNSS